MEKRRFVTRWYLINTYKAGQMLKPGIINEDGSVEQTGHKQVPIQYDKKLFQVEDESGKFSYFAHWNFRVHRGAVFFGCTYTFF